MPPSATPLRPAPALAPVLLGALLAAGGLVGCGSGEAPARNGTLIVALRDAPIHLDPRIATDQASSRVFELALNGLIGKDPEGNLLPELATSWEILDGGARYRFHLRDGVTFHDGRPFGARDVVWTFQSMLDGTLVTAKRGSIPRVQRVVEVDPLTVDFELDEPFGPLLADLTSYLGIVPDGSLPDDNNRLPVGTGPFRVVERSPDRIELVAWEDYWDGRPPMDRLVLRVIPDATVRALELRKGSAQLVVNDLSPDVVVQFRSDPAFRVVMDDGSNYAYIGINLENPILAQLPVRRAIALAIDRARLVETLFQGLGTLTETPIRAGHWSHDPDLEPIPYDPAAARALLDEAGFPDPDGDGPETRFTLTYKTSTEETFVLQAQILQSMLADVGIGIEIRSYEFATFYEDIKAGNFQLFSLIWTGIVDPNFLSLILHSERIPPHGSNRGRYRNPEFDRLLDLGARSATIEERRPYYLEAQEIFARDLPYISLYIRKNVAVMPTDLEGYRNWASGEYYGLRDVRWAGAD